MREAAVAVMAASPQPESAPIQVWRGLHADSDAPVRRIAFEIGEAVGRLTDAELTELAPRHPDPVRRRCAATAVLAAAGERADLDPPRRLAGPRHADVRAPALGALVDAGAVAEVAELGRRDEADRLRPLLRHADPHVRVATLHALLRLDALGLLDVVAALYDPADRVVRAATEVLRHQWFPADLADRLRADPDRPARRRAGQRLAAMRRNRREMAT